MPKRRKSLNSVDKQRDRDPQQQSSPECYEGERLDNVLANLLKSVELAKLSKTGQLPEKIWIKQQFAIGVNDVTRVLERMPPSEGKRDVPTKEVANGPLRRAPLVPLQAVLLASDCSPQLLSKHIPILASSRNVPVIFVKDKKGGSLRLGELVNLKTAIAIGVKDKGSCINRAIDEVLLGQAASH
ncbi:uncharacterized protein M6B38_114105 [Iris pallida]|uniref:Ribosomal protein eL8/eL30/eS12/Gadd45 domain-containing protein n=1 Tax=Iris pallida TaxID=29817 RepID=A0AAX6IKA8_IRIPA|nr:uncharacterized protein M6B38_114105 [Iris pallida]